MADEIERLWRDERFDMMPPHDRRMHRAQVLVAQVMRLASPYICEHEDRDGARHLYDELLKLFWNGGFDIVTDADRADAGLPIRGRDGWTADELLMLERAHLEAMMKPIIIPNTKL